MATDVDYYELLGLQDRRHTDTLTNQEVRQAYKRALLQNHPDKQSANTASLLDRTARVSVSIDDIALAFKVLSDPVLRAEYDREIEDYAHRKARGPTGYHEGTETVDLDELKYEEESGTWLRSCRCGSVPAFVVTEAELEVNVDYGELVVECKGCSLCLKVLFSDGG